MQPQGATKSSTNIYLVSQIRRRLDAEIAPIVVVRGPRQVGKTTAQFQIIAEILEEGVPATSILRVQFDELDSLRRTADTLLLRLIPPLEIRLKKRRGSAKLCLVDHGLRASWLQERIPLTPDSLAEYPELTTMSGHLAESIFGSVASTIHGLDIAHFPERGTDREVDFVLTVGAQRVPVEIRYQRRIDPLRDTLGIRSFLEKSVNNASFGILVTQDDTGTVDDPRIVSLPLSTFMLLR